MNAHTTHFGLSFSALRGALNLPQIPAPRALAEPAASLARPSWLARLATWAERQPMHHRLGSYTLGR
jgi:hypothetical protein